MLVIALLSFYGISTSKEVPFTQEDRYRIIRIEEPQTLMLLGFGILFGGMGILKGKLDLNPKK
ncbi:MAG: hypothetical protein ACK4MW_00280 [Aquificaceae bacterium]